MPVLIVMINHLSRIELLVGCQLYFASVKQGYLRWNEVSYNPPESMVVWVIFWLNHSTFLLTLACTNLRPDSRARSLSAGTCTWLIHRPRLRPLSCFVAHESSIVGVVMVRAIAVVAGPGGRLGVVWPFGHSRHKQLEPMSAETAK